MKSRLRKQQLNARRKLPRQFVKTLLRAIAEADAGKLTLYKYKTRRTPLISEHTQVVLTKAVPALGLEPGDRGVVIHVSLDGKAYEVELMGPDGDTLGIETLELEDVRPASKFV